MISWMQKHKKYLVITIWISTIAFVGAGFVGWGAYKFGSGANAVAEVGDVTIDYKTLQNEYSRLYNYYNTIFQGNFDQEKAKEFGLEKQALQALIQNALLENFAKEHGLIVTDEEVAQKIASMDVFKDKNGQFSKELYLKVLANNRLKPKDFEESIKKELLLAKVQKALEPAQVPLEFDTIASSLFIGDKIEYLPLTSKNIEVNATQEELKSYYDQHKTDYLTPTRYKIALIEVPITEVNASDAELRSFYEKKRLNYRDAEGKVLSFEAAKEMVKKDYARKKSKKEALKTYIAFKKGKIKAQKELTIAENDTSLPQSLMAAIKEANVGQTIKPKETQNGYIIAKLLQKEPPQPMSFQEALPKLKEEYLAQKRAKALEAKAKKLLASFKGERTNYICRDDADKLTLLQKAEALLFLKGLFTSDKSKGYVKISDDKLVLYKILDQKLQMREKIDKNRAFITDNTKRLKVNVQQNGLLQKLQNLYEIKIYKGF